MAARTAAELLVDTLAAHAVERIYCVPGESYLAVLDALHARTDLRLITCRHESGAGFMAVAEAKLTGRPGVAFVSRGPGATNASIAVHAAEQDAVPLLLFIGQVERPNLGRGAFQEVDYTRMFGGMAKCVVEVHEPARISEVVARAFTLSLAGTPGPVIVSLPEDMLAAATTAQLHAPRLPRRIAPSAADLREVARRLGAARRPLLLVGGGVQDEAARAALVAASEAWQVPVAVTNKHQDAFPNAHPHWLAHIGYINPPALLELMESADLVLAVGTRLTDIATQGFKFPRAPAPLQPLVHVHPDPAVIGRNHETALGVVADAGEFLRALAAQPAPQLDRAGWIGECRSLRTRLSAWAPQPAGDGIDFGEVVAALQALAEPDAIFCLDAGGFVSWFHRFFAMRDTQRMVGAVGGGMGMGVPGAVAAALAFPGRQVICLVGDGGFLMTGNELATALQFDARLCVIVANNRSYGVIRAHQEKHYPRRVVGTGLRNPDFAQLARAFGAQGFTASDSPQVADALRQALAAPGPALVEVHTSLDHVLAGATLGSLRGTPSQPA